MAMDVIIIRSLKVGGGN